MNRTPPLITLPSSGAQASTVYLPSTARLGKKFSTALADIPEILEIQEQLDVCRHLSLTHGAEITVRGRERTIRVVSQALLAGLIAFEFGGTIRR